MPSSVSIMPTSPEGTHPYVTDKRPASAADIALSLGSALSTFAWSDADRFCGTW